MMIGGAGIYKLKSATAGVGTMPSNIVVRGNHLRKRPEWRDANLTVKNLFEIKAGENITVEGNIFENTWVSAQMFALNIKADTTTSSGSNATTFYPRTQNITIKNNIIRNADGAFSIQRQSGTHTNAVLANITINNNLFQNVGGSGRQIVINAYKVMDGITISNNLFESKIQTGFLMLLGEVQPLLTNFAVISNVFNYGSQGIKGTGTAIGTATLSAYAPTGTYGGNIVINSPTSVPTYPSGWTFLQATDWLGQNVGINLTTIQNLTANVATGSILSVGIVDPDETPGTVPPPDAPPPDPEPDPTFPEGISAAQIIETLNADFGVNQQGSAYYKLIDFEDSIRDGYDEVVAFAGAIFKATEIAFQANIVYYDFRSLIPDFLAVVGIWNPQTKSWIIPVSYRELEGFRSDWETVTRASGPTYFCPVNYRYVAFHPAAPTATGSMVVFYKAAAEIIASGSVPNLPQDLSEELLSGYVTTDLYEQAFEWKKAQLSFRRYVEKLGELSKRIRIRDSERPSRIGGSW